MKAKKQNMLLAILLSFLMCTSLIPMTSMTAIAGTGDVTIDETNFPDAVFWNYVKTNLDKNNDGILSQVERESVDEIDVHGSFKGIKSLKGLEFFPNLKRLNCSQNSISNIDVSKNQNLEELVCYNNLFNTLDVSKNLNLKYLDVNTTLLTTLDVSKNQKLEKLDCGYKTLESVILSEKPNLKELTCSSSKLTAIDVSKAPNLEKLNVNNNKLTTLDISNNPNLNELRCRKNLLNTLDVSKHPKLTILDCSENKLKTLNLQNNLELTQFDGDYNDLTRLDVSKNLKLIELRLMGNELTALDVSKNLKLKYLHISGNKLSVIDVSMLADLNDFQFTQNHLTSVNFHPMAVIDLCVGSDNSYDIKVKELTRTFDLTSLPGNFVVSKASNWKGGTVSGNILTVDDTKPAKVTYKYKANSRETVEFTLNVNYDKEYTVSFDKNGGSGSMPEVKKTAGEIYVLPTCTFTAPKGKEFKAWEVNGAEKAVGDNIQINANTTVKAIWTAATYTVSVDKNGGSGSMPEIKKKDGETYVLPPCTLIPPDGKEFKTWEVNGEEKAVGDSIQITGDTVLKPIWKTATYTVSFDKNGGSGSMADVKKLAGETYTLPACAFTAPAGKEFKAWEVNGAEKAIGDNIQVNANTTVKAIWKTATYTISFDKNGGSGSMPEIKKKDGETYVLPPCTLTPPDGKEFKAWEVNGEEKAVGDSIQITGDTVLKPIWKDKADKPGTDPQNPSDKPGAGSQNPSNKPGKKPNKPGNSEKKPVNAKVRQNNRDRNNTSNNAKNPKTGESSMLSLYALAILASGGGLIGIRRKSRKEQ